VRGFRWPWRPLDSFRTCPWCAIQFIRSNRGGEWEGASQGKSVLSPSSRPYPDALRVSVVHSVGLTAAEEGQPKLVYIVTCRFPNLVLSRRLVAVECLGRDIKRCKPGNNLVSSALNEL
jgi:hypothetical protein